MSKDWCSSGLRVGILYSRNRRLHKVGFAFVCCWGGRLTAGLASPPKPASEAMLTLHLLRSLSPTLLLILLPTQSLDSITIFPAVSNHTQWALAQARGVACWAVLPACRPPHIAFPCSCAPALTNIAHPLSSSQVLDDAEWCDRFLAGTRAQLESSYDLLTSECGTLDSAALCA